MAFTAEETLWRSMKFPEKNPSPDLLDSSAEPAMPIMTAKISFAVTNLKGSMADCAGIASIWLRRMTDSGHISDIGLRQASF